MNELDWWIASQWEMFKIKEGKTGLEFNKTDKEGNVLTVDRTQTTLFRDISHKKANVR